MGLFPDSHAKYAPFSIFIAAAVVILFSFGIMGGKCEGNLQAR